MKKEDPAHTAAAAFVEDDELDGYVSGDYEAFQQTKPVDWSRIYTNED